MIASSGADGTWTAGSRESRTSPSGCFMHLTIKSRLVHLPASDGGMLIFVRDKMIFGRESGTEIDAK